MMSVGMISSGELPQNQCFADPLTAYPERRFWGCHEWQRVWRCQRLLLAKVG